MAHAAPDGAAKTNRRVGARFILALGGFAAVMFFFIATTSRSPTQVHDQQPALQLQMRQCRASVNARNLGETSACTQIKDLAARVRAISSGLGG